MKTAKRAFAALLIAATLALTPARSANAGLLLLIPTGPLGAIILIIGLVHDDDLLILLDEQGLPSQDGLEGAFAERYPFIDDRDVIAEFASRTREKAKTAPEVDGRKAISFSREEVLEIVEPTGLNVIEPELVEQMIIDLK